MTLKTENQIYADIIGFINSSLAALNISGWQVLQLKQPVKLTDIEPTIYVTATNKSRRGWQARRYFTETRPNPNSFGFAPNYEPFDQAPFFNYIKNFSRDDNFIEQLDVQISALRRRELTDTVNTIGSSDVLEYLKTYILNPNSIQDLRSKGYLIYQPSEVQTPDFFDDSDNFEFMPFFSVTFILKQSLISPQNSIDSIQIKGVYGI